MAFAVVEQASRDRLAAMRGVTIIGHPAPCDPAAVAMIIAVTRCYEVRSEDGLVFAAAYHPRMGEWLDLLGAGTRDDAFDAIRRHVEKVGHLLGTDWDAIDAADRAAAAEVLADLEPIADLPLAA